MKANCPLCQSNNVTKTASCYDCKKPYGEDDWIEAIIPDKIWVKISPYKNESGILCISCIAKRLKEAGYGQRDRNGCVRSGDNIPVWLCGTEPLMAIEGDPNNYLDWIRNYDIKAIKE